MIDALRDAGIGAIAALFASTDGSTVCDLLSVWCGFQGTSSAKPHVITTKVAAPVAALLQNRLRAAEHERANSLS